MNTRINLPALIQCSAVPWKNYATGFRGYLPAKVIGGR